MNYWQKMYDKLNALPPEKRRLATRVVWDKDADCGCALGTLVGKEAWPPTDESFTVTLVRIDDGTAPKGAKEALDEFGLIDHAWRISYIEVSNDAFKGPKAERFEYMLAWFKERATLEERAARDKEEAP